MLKKKQYIYSFVLIFCILFTLAFHKEICCFGIRSFFNLLSSKKIDAKIDFKNVEIKNKKIVLKQVVINSDQKYQISADTINIKFNFNLFKAHLNLLFDCFEPKVILYKNQDFFNKKISLEKSKFISWSFNVKHAKLSFIDNKKVEKEIFFDLFNISPSSSQFEIAFEKGLNKKIFGDVNNQINKKIFSCYLNEVESGNINYILQFLNIEIFQELKGFANGLVIFDISDNKVTRFFTNLEFANLSFKNPETSLKFDFQKLRVESNYPDICQNESQFFKNLKINCLKQAKLRINFDNLTILTPKDTSFAKIQGYLSYNPNLGSKIFIKGNVENSKNFDFLIDSKAYISSSFSNWMDVNLNFDNKKTNISLNIKEIDNHYDIHFLFNNIQNHVFSAFQDLLCSLNHIDDFKFLEGSLNFCLDTKFDSQGISTVFLNDLEFKDFLFEKNEIKGLITEMKGKGSLDLSSRNIWDQFFADFQIKNSSFEIDKKIIRNFNGKIFAVEGIFQSSCANFDINDVASFVEIKGKIDEFDTILQSKGVLKEFSDSFSTSITCKRKKGLYSCSGNVQLSDDSKAEFGFDLDSVFVSKITDLKKNILNGWVRADQILLSKWIKILDLDYQIDGKANFAVFYNNNKLYLQMTGEDLVYKNSNIDIKINKIGNLNEFLFEKNQYIEASLENNILTCKMPSFEGMCYLPKFNLFFDLKEADVCIDNNILQAKVLGLSENVDLEGKVEFDFSKKYPLLTIDIERFQSDIKSFQNLLEHFEYKNDLKVTGNISGNSKIVTYFNENIQTWRSINFTMHDAKYNINEKACIENFIADGSLASDFILSNISGDLKLAEKGYKIFCPLVKVADDNLDFDFRIEKDIFEIFRFKGCFLKNNDKYHLCLNDENTHAFGQKIDNLELILSKNFEIEHFKAFAKVNSFAFISQLQFLSDSGLLPIYELDFSLFLKRKHSGNLNIFVGLDEDKNFLFEVFSKKLKIFDNDFSNFVVNGKKNNSNIEVKKFNFDDFETSFIIEQAAGSLKLRDCILKKKDALFLKLNGTYLPNSSVINANIEDIKLDLKKINSFPYSFIKLPAKSIEGHLNGSGILSFILPKKDTKFNILCDLDFEPSNLTIEKLRLYNNGLLNMNFSLDRGLLIQGLDLTFYNKDVDLSYLSCKIGGVVYNFHDKMWMLNDADICVPQSFKSILEKNKKYKGILEFFPFNEDMELTSNIQLYSDLSNIIISAKKETLLINSKKYEFKDIYLNLKERNCFAKFDFSYKNNNFTIENNISLEKNIWVKTTFLEKSKNQDQPLCLTWLIDENNEFQVKEINGNFFGMNFLMQEDIENPSINKLFGTVKIDFSRLKNILPKNLEKPLEHYSIGKNYEISGTFSFDVTKKSKNVNFEGLFSGKDFELLGYQFKTMFSKINISLDKIKFSDFKISDQAGILSINEIDLDKNENKWRLSIPILKIKDLRPSLMQKIGAALGDLTPFLIRDFCLSDFKGDLGFENSFSGNGNFVFINSFKRNFSIFDFPSDVLSRIVGIDQELLTPVKGKVDFKVKDAKFYLTKLHDSYSEGERSKFFLLDKNEKPYVDFDGNIYINVAMKQYVLFKFTESFVISIRGNLQNPHYNLKKKRGFLN